MLKKNLTIIGITLLSMLLFLTLPNVKADTISSTETQDQNITNLFSKADNYVTLKGNFFVLDKGAEKVFSNSELETINAQIFQTNKILSESYSESNT